MPVKTGRAVALPRSPAINTWAHAVPSGKGSVACSSIVSACRSGIMSRMPRMPASAPIRKICSPEGCSSRNISAGTVKITPAASDSPVEAIAWTTLFSSTVPRRRRPRSTVIDSTADGIDAETVIPTFRPRYAFTMPNVSDSTMPSATASGVSSGGLSSGDTYGRSVRASVICSGGARRSGRRDSRCRCAPRGVGVRRWRRATRHRPAASPRAAARGARTRRARPRRSRPARR